MKRFVRLGLFAVVVGVIAAASVLLLREPLLRAAGVDLPRGTPGRTSVVVPDGFEVGVFAAGLSRPRFGAVDADGTLYVAEMGADRIVALPDVDGDGEADEIVEVGSGYGSAHSLAFASDGSMLVAGAGSLLRVQLDALGREESRETILSYPQGGGHFTRTVVVRPDGSLLVSVGSSCNVCWEADEERASVLLAEADGGSARVLMRGLRNAVGVAIDPATGAAWVTNNGRDFMGDDLPPETVYRLVDGADAGWPRCHAGGIVDPDFGDVPDPATGLTGCDGVVAPDAEFQAHAAPLGITFWRDHAVIAFHGSWNRSEKVGYEVLRLPWDDGPAGPPEALATGFLDTATGNVSGRPAGVIVGGDDALYVTDDRGGFVYRITAAGDR